MYLPFYYRRSMRIWHHDALVNIAYNALSPAYFDISIGSTTQLAFMSFSVSCAGVAAAAGEVRSIWQLWRRWDLILSPWCRVFCSLDSICFEDIMCNSDCTTSHSGVPCNLVRKILLQQLSAALWTNNARGIGYFRALILMTIPSSPSCIPCMLSIAVYGIVCRVSR